MDLLDAISNVNSILDCDDFATKVRVDCELSDVCSVIKYDGATYRNMIRITTRTREEKSVGKMRRISSPSQSR